MVRLEPAFDPAVLEEEARGLWRARGLPPPGGFLGLRGGPLTLQFEGTFTPSDPESLVVHRAVAADVDARYLALEGRRAYGTLRFEAISTLPGAPQIEGTLARLGIWVGGDGTVPWDATSRHARVEAMVGRLAHRGVLVSRDLPMRSCPVCGVPRSPEEIIYQEEDGSTYLVRFQFSLDGRAVSALVWVDAPWRLLGTSALLVHPDLSYVVARCRQGTSEELVLTSRSSLERLRAWSPRATFEIVEEHPGRYFEGREYDYPLRHEFPTGGTLPAPNGTILAVPDVTDSGTGIVPLVPGHGSTDAEIAGARGVAGWPLVTPKGQLDLTLMHKYSGLDLETGSEFIVRDLEEGEAIFARLKIRRGVPHCAACGSPLLWIPGRAWCLEPSRFPARQVAEYARLLPGAPSLDRVEVAPWPVSATGRHDDPEAVALLECSRCERLDALGAPVECSCGARRFPVRRRLIPSAAGALAAWARLDSYPSGAPIRLYAGDRRRVPTVVHQLMALSAIDGEPGEVGLSVLPTVSDVVLSDLVTAYGSDAVRAAFVRATTAERASGAFPEHCRAERDRLAHLWSTIGEILGACDDAMLSGFGQPITGFLGELEAEDRALLARWERARVLALTDYDHHDPESAYRRVFRFLETDFAQYRLWVRFRTSLPGSPTTKRAAFRTLVYALRESMTVLGPVCPHTADSIYRRLAMGGSSLFEGSLPPADRSLLNDELCTAWDRWTPVIRGVAEFRRQCGVGRDVAVPSMALVVADDGLGDLLRSDKPVLERLARVDRIDVGSPRSGWTGRRRELRPVESEIQRAYPSQAAQIAHLLVRSPARPLTEGSAASELSVVIQGQPIRIFPSMVTYVETLPAGFVPHPWSRGEMYLELPTGGKKPERMPPPLSSDALWLIRRLDRRLRAFRGSPSSSEPTAVVACTEPLLGELRRHSEAVAHYLGLLEFRVVDLTAEHPPEPVGRLVGRSRTGSPWWIDTPGLVPVPRRTKRRLGRPRCRRVPVGPPGKPALSVDLGSDELLERSQAVRRLGSELDDILGVPLLGPTKLAGAWEVGLQSVEAYRTAPFEKVASLRGFGPEIAHLLAQKLGGSLPSPGDARGIAGSTGPPVPRQPPPSTVEARETPSRAEALPIAPSVREEEISGAAEAPPPAPSSGPTGEEADAASIPVPQTGETSLAETSPPSGTSAPTMESNPAGTPEIVPLVPNDLPSGIESEPAAPSEPPSAPPASGESGEEFEGAPAQPEELPEAGEPTSDESVPPPEEPQSTETPLPEPELQELGPTPAAQEPAVAPTESPPTTLPPVEVELSPAAAPEAEVSPSQPSEPPTPESVGGAEVPEPPVEPEVGEAEAETSEPTAEPTGVGSVEAEMPPSAPSPPEEESTPEVPVVSPPASSAPAGAGPTGSEPSPEPVPPVVLVPPTSTPVGVEAVPPPATPPAAAPLIAPPPPAPARAPAPSGIEFEIGSSPFTSIQPFLDATAAGHRGVCLVRESPERVTAQVGPRPVDVYWLTNLGRGKTLRPSDLPGIFALLQRAIDQDHVTALFLEGIEYLIRLHGVEELVGRLSDLDRRARAHDARVWVHLTPDLLRPADLKRVTAALGSEPSG